MKKSVAALKAYQAEQPLAAIKDQYQLETLARLSANESVYGPTPKVKEALAAVTFDRLNYYPDGSAQKLRQAVAQLNQVDPEMLVFGVGADELIQLLTRLALEPGQNIIVPAPTFGEYAIHAQIEQAETKSVAIDANTGHVDFEGILAAVDDQTSMVWLANPNNPTGVLESAGDIQGLLQQLPESVYLVVDEAYIDFADTSDNTVVPLLADYPNLIILRTLSKAYGLANLRIGYGMMDVALAQKLNAVRLPYNLSDFQIEAGTAAVLDQDYLQKTVAKVQAERNKFEDFLRENQFEFYPSQTNFLWVQVGDAKRYGQALLKEGLQISQRLSPSWVRITLGQSADNERMRQLLVKIREENKEEKPV
ncbi:histidinol-phosphate transaminase [Fructobacillus tropaeoli]|uniref:histidinol-phosphate transaminase n=1 Tax=Fructobacillus tropaeoli TaxID=709323 RepID=UPI002DA39397|nr:Histidinol-phosphate/aromatic aminotransferase or cobyric acid decarboxylase (HisC) [Fructobacillus tropaeoli]